MTRNRVTLITLGVQDMDRARAFYRAWGWQEHSASQPGLALYQMNGAALALFQIAELAQDQSRAEADLGRGAITLAQNCADDDETDAVFAAALAAGASAIKLPETTFWAGYSSYFADPDGHVWEIATNPFWPLDAQGNLTLPG